MSEFLDKRTASDPTLRSSSSREDEEEEEASHSEKVIKQLLEHVVDLKMVSKHAIIYLDSICAVVRLRCVREYCAHAQYSLSLLCD